MNKPCLVCKSSKTRSFSEKFGYRLRKCLDCDLVFLSNPPVREELYQIYQKGYFTGDKRVIGYFDYEGDKKNLIKNFSKRLSIIKRYKNGGRLLDVGCATGIFGLQAQKKGFDVYGVDVSPFTISHAQKRIPNKVFLTSLLKFSPQIKFDVITMWDVLEHFLDPKQNLLKASKLLKDHGLLVLTTGDVKSFWAKLTGKNWHGLIPPQHITYFSSASMQKILEITGFKTLTILKEGKWVSLRYILHIVQGIGQNRLAEKFYNFIKISTLGKRSIYLNLFDSLLVVGVKK